MQAREYLISIDPANRTILENIQGSLFVLSLDDAKPYATPENYTPVWATFRIVYNNGLITVLSLLNEKGCVSDCVTSNLATLGDSGIPYRRPYHPLGRQIL